MPDNIVIVDYGMGNLRSVQKKIQNIEGYVIIGSTPEEILTADRLILPGVGHFTNGVRRLKESGLWDVLNRKVLIDKTPILGICLGMQLMGKSSEEGGECGFGWFDAEITKFRVRDSLKFKVPHMGWNSIDIKRENPLMTNIDAASLFYFVHSFHFNCNNQNDVLASTIYEYEFPSVIQKENIYGAQFHPEKSHDCGEKLLMNFLKTK